jgi:hypothetical protein
VRDLDLEALDLLGELDPLRVGERPPLESILSISIGRNVFGEIFK